MQSFSHNLKSIMMEKQIKAAELSRMTGISKARISQYTNGIYIPKAAALDAIANALGVNRDVLLGNKTQTSLPYKHMPLLGNISCGIPVFVNQENGERIITDKNIDADFCLIARGDSMKDARICNGDIVFLKSCEMVNNGEIAAVVINDEATLKRVYYYPEQNKIMLIPENPKYQPLIYTNQEIDGIRIIGRAVAFRSQLI